MKTKIIKFGLSVVAVLTSAVAFAGKIQTCRADGSYCLAQVENGIVGDQVRILDERASQVASGQIEKKNSTVVLIRVQTKTKIPKRGYPVLVTMTKKLKITPRKTQWASAFSNAE